MTVDCSPRALGSGSCRFGPKLEAKACCLSGNWGEECWGEEGWVVLYVVV